MTTVDVVGGVYGERCFFPHWDAIYGSAGRAAAAISGWVDNVQLHTMFPTDRERQIRPILETFCINLNLHGGKQFIGFEYLYCLADPVISPHPSCLSIQPGFEVRAEVAILFGMLECVPTVRAEVCVYDPQSPHDPKLFSETASTAKRLAFIANAQEVRRLTGKPVCDGARDLLKSQKAEVVVVKCGLRGLSVFTNTEKCVHVPAYRSSRVFTIGSGDVFAAAFAFAWGIEGKSAGEAADCASRRVARYVETRTLPIQESPVTASSARTPVKINQGQVYLAGSFRNIGQLAFVNEARRQLWRLGIPVFSPIHDIGPGRAEKVVARDLEALRSCDAVLALLSSNSPGTIFEVGYAVAQGKPTFCVAQGLPENDLKLPVGPAVRCAKIL